MSAIFSLLQLVHTNLLVRSAVVNILQRYWSTKNRGKVFLSFWNENYSLTNLRENWNAVKQKWFKMEDQNHSLMPQEAEIPSCGQWSGCCFEKVQFFHSWSAERLLKANSTVVLGKENQTKNRKWYIYIYIIHTRERQMLLFWVCQHNRMTIYLIQASLCN